MTPQIISAKELRLKFPEIRRKLGRGTPFIVVHRSRPLANLTPIAQEQKKPQKWPLDKIIGGMNWGKGLKRKLDADYIEELAESIYD